MKSVCTGAFFLFLAMNVGCVGMFQKKEIKKENPPKIANQTDEPPKATTSTVPNAISKLTPSEITPENVHEKVDLLNGELASELTQMDQKATANRTQK